ncbi:succinylglutamate desuccinylase/aspartoacylase family protein [Lacimicrobium sp. SS2-24]|uniref:succinylglutamate desuccinylase/aspartoacylase domain-containing protein n=1 Tax=Lacimicrobium sp. SS2-24 TaxID=2005569 RepID=UPI000B4B164A|nr:succinylglutamate desuccinylase/aspartoacylase family protein [Lacimicrobium sp. SS2-24]
MSGIHLQHLHPPFELAKGKTLSRFLHYLPGPCVFHIPGKNRSQCRIIVTLLHGNEPSGLKALHRLLNEDFIPEVETKFIIASVAAAKTEPLFSHRMLPGQADLNRCFGKDIKDLQHQLAQAIEAQIRGFSPQAVVDMHNTSGSGPAFCVSTQATEQHLALASHFSHRMILTPIRLGAIMEQELGGPIITVEAGGAQDEVADRVAYNGLISFLSAKDVFVSKQHVEQLKMPRRVELSEGCDIAYADVPLADKAVTLHKDIEKYNFGETPEGTALGWINNNNLNALSLDGDANLLTRWFRVERNQLMTKCPLKLFMITTNADIAKSDCLFYVVED